MYSLLWFPGGARLGCAACACFGRAPGAADWLGSLHTSFISLNCVPANLEDGGGGGGSDGGTCCDLCTLVLHAPLYC